MGILRRILIQFLQRSQISINITGFDTEAFSQALHRELTKRLDTIAYIVFEDEDMISDGEKIAAIKQILDDSRD